jgi:spore coat protein U-like protein
MAFMKSLGLMVTALSMLGLCPLPVEAATAQSTIGVSATVQATCLNTASPLAFGTYTGAVVNTTATITVTCTNTTAYTVSLDVGTSVSATLTTRRMTGPAGALLGYGMFSNAAHSANWGNSVTTGWVTGTATGRPQPLTVYGEVVAGQFVAPGAYTDTVTATVTY